MGDRAAAARLHAAGRTPPLPLLLLHGWSPGPGLPGSLLASGLFTVHEIEASTVLTIATNRYALALAALTVVCVTLIARADLWYAWLALLPLAAVVWRLKQLAVAHTLDSNVAEARRAIARLHPAAVVGYSWGGAIAECCIETGVWSGPTLLLAPCGALLSGHAGRSPPTLARLKPLSGAAAEACAPSVTLIHGEADAIVSVEDSYNLAQSAAARGVCELIIGKGDDHFLWRSAPRHVMQDALITMITGSSSSSSSSSSGVGGSDDEASKQ